MPEQQIARSLAQLIELYNRQERQEVQYPGVRRETAPGIVRHAALEPDDRGMVIYSDLRGADVDAAIQEQIAYFANLGQEFEWKVYDFDEPPDLKERLARHGFEIGDAEALLVLDLQQAPPFLLEPVAHDIRRVASAAELDTVIEVEEAVWDEDMAELRSFLAVSLEEHGDQMSVYLAYADGVPASSAWIYFAQDSHFASLWGGSTLAQYRRRGLYTALLAARLQEALARGVRYLTVDASPDSRPILQKFGFQLLGFTYECNWRPQTPGP